MQELILFDIDGTLLKTGGAGLRSLNLAFEEVFGIAGAFDGVSFVGTMDSRLFHDVAIRHFDRPFEAMEQEALTRAYVSHLQADLSTLPVEVLPGVNACLQSLSVRNDTFLAIATGNLEAAAWVKLKAAGLDHYFSVGGFGLDGSTRLSMTRTALQSALNHFGLAESETRVWLVGDSIYDMECAVGIGAIPVGVTTGWTSGPRLDEAGAAFLLQGLDTFPALIQS